MALSNMFSAARDKIRELVWGDRTRVVVSVEGVAVPDPRDTSVPADIITYPGDRVVCDGPGQHIVAEALFTIKRGDDSSDINRQFVWFQAPPEVGTPMLKIRCQHCDGRWCSSGMHLHFKGGWR